MNEVFDPTDTALVSLPDDNRLAYFTKPDGAGLDPILDSLRQRIEAFEPPDVTTQEGRDRIKANAWSVTKSKTYLEGIGKDLAAEQKKIPGLIDATRRKSKETLERWAEEVRKPLTEWENAEEVRKFRHQSKLSEIVAMGTIFTTAQGEPFDVATLTLNLAAVEAVAISAAACEEYIEEYRIAKKDARNALREALARAELREAEQAELAQLRAEKAARDEQERIMAEAREREKENERIVAEAKERTIAEAQERDRIAAETEARVKRDAEEAEEAKDREAARRASDRENVSRVRREIKEDLMKHGFDEDTARRVVIALVAGVPHVTITY